MKFSATVSAGASALRFQAVSPRRCLRLGLIVSTWMIYLGAHSQTLPGHSDVNLLFFTTAIGLIFWLRRYRAGNEESGLGPQQMIGGLITVGLFSFCRG